MKIVQLLKESKVYDFVFGLLIFFSVFGSSIVNLFLGLSVLLYLISFDNIKKKQLIGLFKSPFLFLLLFIIYVYIEALVVGVLNEKRFQLLYLIPILLILGTNVRSIFKVGISFVFGNLLLMLIGLFKITNAYFSDSNFTLKEGALVNKLMLLERPYLGFVCVLSVLILMFLIQNTQKLKKVYLVVIFSFIGYIVFISARLALISLIFILLIYFVAYAKIKWYYKSLSFIFILISFLGFNYVNPTLADRFLIFSDIDFQSEQIKDYEPRVIIWECASEIIKNENYNKLFGLISTEKLTESLVSCYKTDEGNLVRRGFFIQTKFNTHNQYLDLFITTGYIGVLFLALLAIGIFYRNVRNFFVVGFLLALGMFLITENGLSRQMGVYLISIVFVFIYHFSKLTRINSN